MCQGRMDPCCPPALPDEPGDAGVCGHCGDGDPSLFSPCLHKDLKDSGVWKPGEGLPADSGSCPSSPQLYLPPSLALTLGSNLLPPLLLEQSNSTPKEKCSALRKMQSSWGQ